MKVTELKKIARIMKDLGITHFKTAEYELSMPLAWEPPPPKPPVVHKPVEISSDETEEIKHRLEELTSVMKLGDEDLMERLFPETQLDLMEQ